MMTQTISKKLSNICAQGTFDTPLLFFVGISFLVVQAGVEAGVTAIFCSAESLTALQQNLSDGSTHNNRAHTWDFDSVVL